MRVDSKCKFAPVVTAALLILAASLSAQEKPDTVGSIPGIQIETSVDRAEMYVGDLINYTVTVTYDSAIKLLPPPLGANLGSFDVKDYQTDISNRLPDGRIKSQSHFVLSTFTTGDYIIPPVPMAFEFPDGKRKIMLSESVPIKVNSLLLNTDDSIDIRPLKAQYEFQRDYTKLLILSAIIILLLSALSYFIWRKMRAKVLGAQIDLRPCWEIAFEKLAKLGQKNLVNEGHFKEYYLELTEILKTYLGRMFTSNVTDMTTDEFLENYETIGPPDDLKEKLKEFFNHADLVKFAKLVPDVARCGIDFEFAHELIERIRRDFQLKAEIEARIQRPISSGSSLKNREKVK